MTTIFLALAFLFFFGSLLGWVIELFYRRIKGKKWVNPGFLHGPYLPIYGLGLVILFLLCRIPFDVIPYYPLQILARLALMCVCMTGIEYIGGIIFIKGMGIKLWDYSKRFGNIQGIICPLFSLIWTASGALYYFLLDTFFYNSVMWLFDNLAFSFVVGLFFGVFIVDLAITTQLGLRLRSFAKEHQIVIRYEKLKSDVQDYLKEIKGKIHFIAPLRTPQPIENFLEKYFGKKKEEGNDGNALPETAENTTESTSENE
ncbi:MAG: putative ABC transporter permease [Clostridia bacterium]|nr:putative ABC transporter permease [Clostridia bacterium]